MNTILSASSAHHVHLGDAPRAAVRAITTPQKPSPIVARAHRARAAVVSARARIARCVAIAIGWALLGIYCAQVFAAFRGL